MWSSLSFYHYGDKDFKHVMRATMWCTRFILFVAIMCIICERLLSTRIETKILVNDVIMDYNQPPLIRLQAKAFMELIEEWPLTISKAKKRCVTVCADHPRCPWMVDFFQSTVFEHKLRGRTGGAHAHFPYAQYFSGGFQATLCLKSAVSICSYRLS
ncbi:hypothetical protein EVAR_84760_1 [Eumeta japonica]|uniref:Uncharacterized protein n=1 Tax=Eumeta variegata TaxID=151549 RepID=A0A4C1U7X7_EUMVA|nr:hypothetical protein EVAR_84760_1 [Eumeta japonica]